MSKQTNGFVTKTVLLLLVIGIIAFTQSGFSLSSNQNIVGKIMVLASSGESSTGALEANTLGPTEYGKGTARVNQYIQVATTAPASASELNIVFVGPIPSPQKSREPFPVKISANDTNFTGTVYLQSAFGLVEPNHVDLVKGYWSGNLILHEVGLNNFIELRWSDKNHSGTSVSNTFDVLDKNAIKSLSMLSGIRAPAILKGKVVGSDSNQPVVGAVVTVSSGNTQLATTKTDSQGAYELVGVLPGVHQLDIQQEGYDSTTQRVTIAKNRTITADAGLKTICSPTPKQLTPVLLVPGIMGSYSKAKSYFWPYPRLSSTPPAWDSGELALFDPFLMVGWEKLAKALQREGYVRGCTLFDVPYDWSLSIIDIRDKYLIPWIEKAKKVSGNDRVDIIAHSMGGLVARSYIQSDLYKHDIRKLAMLGTPNQGSATVYYIWEAGDPVTLDIVTRDTQMLSPTAYFYTNTLNYFNYDHRGDYMCQFSDIRRYEPTRCDNSKIYDFAHSKALSSGQLMPVYIDALHDSTDNRNLPIAKEENTLVKALNQQQCLHPEGCVDSSGKLYSFKAPHEVFTKDVGTDQVETRLFIGTGQDTIDFFTVKPQPPDYTGKFYLDGVVQEAKKSTDGDGTVLARNVLFDSDLQHVSKSSPHSYLVAAFVPELLSFVKPGAKPLLMLEAPKITLGVGISGRVQLTLKSITASREEDADKREALFKNAEYEHQIHSSQLQLENPVDGRYAIELFSPQNESYELSILYFDQNKQLLVTKTYWGFFSPDSLKEIVLEVNTSDAEEPVKFVDRHFGVPTELQVNNVDSKVKLVWQDPVGDANQDVSYYEIYWKKDYQPYMGFLGKTADNRDKSYVTDHDWANAKIDNYSYAVRAVLKEGKGSTFLSQPTVTLEPM